MSTSEEDQSQVAENSARVFGLRKRNQSKGSGSRMGKKSTNITYTVALAEARYVKGFWTEWVYVVPSTYMSPNDDNFLWPDDESKVSASVLYAGNAHTKTEMTEIQIKRVYRSGITCKLK